MSETTTLAQAPAPKLGTTKLQAAAGIMLVLGLGGMLWACIDGGPQRGFSALITGLAAPLWLAVGALFFIAAHSLAGAFWTVPLRRLMEGLTLGLWPAAIGFAVLSIIVIATAGGHIGPYAWANDGRDALFHAADGTKKAWMQPWRFALTGATIFAILLLVRQVLVGMSLRQDGGADITAGHKKWSVIALFALGYGFTLLVWDLLLSLEVNWVSAAWGVYCFVGAVHAFLAVLALLAVWQHSRQLKDVVRTHHLHDIGTWLVGWACIVAYITFAQYTIIWYANLPEETFWFLKRSQHGYGALYIAEAVLRNLLPFALLMSQRFRACPRMLAIVAVLVLAGTAIDLAWIVVPAFSPNHFRIPLPEILAALGFVGATLLFAVRFWRTHGLLASGDPKLLPSINAEHLH